MTTSAGGTDEYVVALRTSTDRARNLLYVVAVTTVLVFAVHHNIADDSWPRRRLDAWYRYAKEPIPPYVASGDRERLQDLRDAYVQQFVSRVVFAASPIPGVAMDVNDLPLVGGLALTLLMILLTTAIAREHESLYLALYKVRLICEEEGPECSRGGSRANLLYHALAMTQMLNSPPTLARWKPQPFIAPLWRLAFLLPFLVYWQVVRTEMDTMHYSYFVYHIDAERSVKVYAVLGLVLFILGVLSWAHTSAMAERWDRAFLRINPQRRAAPQTSWLSWLRVRFAPLNRERLRRQQLTSAIVDALVIRDREEPAETYEVPVEVSIPCDAKRIGLFQVRRMRKELLLAGAKEANAAKAQLLKFAATSSTKNARDWVVTGIWTVRTTCPSPRDAGRGWPKAG